MPTQTDKEQPRIAFIFCDVGKVRERKGILAS